MIPHILSTGPLLQWGFDYPAGALAWNSPAVFMSFDVVLALLLPPLEICAYYPFCTTGWGSLSSAAEQRE